MIQTAASASGLGLESVSTLFSALLLNSWVVVWGDSASCLPHWLSASKKGPKRSWESEFRETTPKGGRGNREERPLRHMRREVFLLLPYSTPIFHYPMHFQQGVTGRTNCQKASVWTAALPQLSLLSSRNRALERDELFEEPSMTFFHRMLNISPKHSYECCLTPDGIQHLKYSAREIVGKLKDTRS